MGRHREARPRGRWLTWGFGGPWRWCNWVTGGIDRSASRATAGRLDLGRPCGLGAGGEGLGIGVRAGVWSGLALGIWVRHVRRKPAGFQDYSMNGLWIFYFGFDRTRPDPEFSDLRVQARVLNLAGRQRAGRVRERAASALYLFAVQLPCAGTHLWLPRGSSGSPGCWAHGRSQAWCASG